MKVAFNARLLNAPTLRGWNRYTINLLAHLPALGVELFLYSDHALHEAHLARLPLGSYHVRLQQAHYFFWEQHWLPRQCQRDGVDLLHCPLNFGLPWRSWCPRVLTLHDAIDQLFYLPGMTWRQSLRPAAVRSRLHHWIARRRAEHIITVSEHARGDLVAHLRVDPRRITVIPEAADPHFHNPVSAELRQALREKYTLKNSYFLYVGGWERRKNVPFLLRAFAGADLPDVELVLVGGKEDEKCALQRLATELKVMERVRLLGWVEDADLPALYSEAIAFVYPSEYEGFGLQLCEAMATGCPILAADRTSLPEVLGDGGLLFPLDDGRTLATLMRQLAAQPEMCRVLSRRSRTRAAHYSWKETARETVAVYQRAKGSIELTKTIDKDE